MNAFQLAEIPDELAAEAAQVPGLSKRLLNFLRAEVLSAAVTWPFES